MGIYRLTSIQRIPVSPEVAWKFFASPDKLGEITPPGFKFRLITKDAGESLYEGQVLAYRIRPLFGLPLTWKTIIKEVKENEYFADEQLKGPYKLWRHEHYFKPIEGGVEMKDLVKYQNPFGILGTWVNGLLVKKKLMEIFEFRFRRTEEILGKWKEGSLAIEFDKGSK
jgi:ligand-binding SRPBCC domain-containing protein